MITNNYILRKAIKETNKKSDANTFYDIIKGSIYIILEMANFNFAKKTPSDTLYRQF